MLATLQNELVILAKRFEFHEPFHEPKYKPGSEKKTARTAVGMQEQSRIPKTGSSNISSGIECSLDTYLLFGLAPVPVRFASALLMDLPLFWMDQTLFWPHASRVGYGHRWPFSLRIVNKAVSRTQLVWREACPAKRVGTNHSAMDSGIVAAFH